jgi:hypothetical protein
MSHGLEEVEGSSLRAWWGVRGFFCAGVDVVGGEVEGDMVDGQRVFVCGRGPIWVACGPDLYNICKTILFLKHKPSLSL